MPEKNEKIIEDDNLKPRPPVAVVLGHVDHGKSSVLEAIKDFKITAKESGGITQHIGAYEIEHDNKSITFIDTPGHEAFSAMRSRGAKVADLAVLVVAAEEGVKPQTKEAISIIKELNLPFVVAINKIDKPEANPEGVKRGLSQENVLVEGFSGKIPVVEISAKTGQGISELLEVIILLAEIEQLKGDFSTPGQGAVIESRLDPLRGPTATLILQNGILKTGDIIGTFSCFGKIKKLENFQGKEIETAFPSMPVVVFGFEQVPTIGEEFKIFPDLEEAKKHLQKQREPEKKSVSLTESDKKTLNLILKADVLGSCQVLEEVLKKIPQEKVFLSILKSEAGEIQETDIKLARTTGARILGFRVKTSPIARNLAEREKIKIINFEVIYELVEAVRNLMEKTLEPEIVKTELGEIKILAKFMAEKNRQILGGKVTWGEIKRGPVEIFREEEKIGKGRIINLKRDKKEIERADKGAECGLLYEGETKAEEGDILLAFKEERKKGEL